MAHAVGAHAPHCRGAAPAPPRSSHHRVPPLRIPPDPSRPPHHHAIHRLRLPPSPVLVPIASVVAPHSPPPHAMAGTTLAFAAPRRAGLFRRGRAAGARGTAAAAVAVGAVPIPALVPSRTRLPGRGGRGTLAAAIPGNSVVESVTIGGFANFFGIYGNLLIARVLLSWFPAAQVRWERCGGCLFGDAYGFGGGGGVGGVVLVGSPGVAVGERFFGVCHLDGWSGQRLGRVRGRTSLVCSDGGLGRWTCMGRRARAPHTPRGTVHCSLVGGRRGDAIAAALGPTWLPPGSLPAMFCTTAGV